MNVFHLRQGAVITSVNAQLIRMAPPGSQVCIVELMGDPADEKLADEVATVLATSRRSQLAERVVQGYQLGTLPEMRTRQYKLYFME
jgi:hypothetical protein